jgi:hypothetical protein
MSDSYGDIRARHLTSRPTGTRDGDNASQPGTERFRDRRERMSTLTEIPELAAHLIEDVGWTQGEMEEADGSVCLHGAIRECTPQKGDAEIVRALARQQGLTEGWNDKAVRTEGEVLSALRHLDVSDDALAATFGPNWELVVGVIRRAATLTDDEVQRMGAAWDAALGSAWEAARGAARVAAWGAARVAARATARGADAALAAARAAALGATRAATLACVVRDLITPEQFDILTGPWVSVVGPFEAGENA